MSGKKVRSARDKKEFLIIFLCWLAYTSAYLGKYSYVSNELVISKFYEVTKDQTGLVSTLFFITYGIGQVINAFLCKYYPKRTIVTIALALSAAVNFTLFFKIPFEIIKYLWILNAAAQAVLWPTLVQIISMYISKDKMKTSVLAMSTTVAVGTCLAYGLSALMVQIASFKATFMFTAIYLAIIAVVWFVAFGASTKNLPLVSAENEEKQVEKEISATIVSNEQALKKKREHQAFIVTLCCFFLYAIINNFVKDGLTLWVPDVLHEKYHLSESLSIVFTIVLPIFGVFGAFTATFLNKYIKDFVIMCGIFFVTASMFELGVIGLFSTKLWWLVLICFGIISLLMHAINNVITSMFALYMPDNSKAGLYSGLLNGACYVGSALSGYGLGAFAEHFAPDWLPVFYLLLGCCLVPVLISLVVGIVKLIIKRKDKKSADAV